MTALGVYSFTPGEKQPSQAIVEAVARYEGVDVTEIEPPAYEPLYAVVDPEALDVLFEATGHGATRTGRVTLRYAGYDVVVSSDGHVELSEVEPQDGRVKTRRDDGGS